MLRELNALSRIVRNAMQSLWLQRRIRVENHRLRALDANEDAVEYRRRARLLRASLEKQERDAGLSPWDAQMALHLENPLYWSYPTEDVFPRRPEGGR